ncbi:MAG: hypothetical protein KGY41_04080 [Desulfovermiculus sp.]|nr:hypothetical protein [Desulfovermiculus sp.]
MLIAIILSFIRFDLTSTLAPSTLILSHAVLILLYECFKRKTTGLKRRMPEDSGDVTTRAELRLHFETMQDTLERIDFLHEQNTSSTTKQGHPK